MYSTLVSSTLSLKCRGSDSFSCYDHSYCSSDRFGRYPLAYSSSLSTPSCPSCCSCYTTSVYRVPLCPSPLYGLRQSTLIQCKRTILGGLDRAYSRFSDFGADRDCCYEKICSFTENGVRKRGGQWGKGRYRCLVFEERSDRCSASDLDEAEVMLSLLTEDVDVDVDVELLGLRERNRRLSKRIEAEKREYRGPTKNVSKKKRDESGIVQSKLKYKHESRVIPSRKEENRRDWREEEREARLRRDSERTSHKEEERASLLRESYRKKATEEEREDHRQGLRKDQSSCSSYYSVSSTGELDSDSEIQIENERFEEESSGQRGEYLKSEGAARYDGVGERVKDSTAEQGVVSRKEDSEVGLYVASAGAACDWRKKSEKKLTDISVEETESRKESTEMHSRISQIHGSSSEKVTGSYNKYDGSKKESTSFKNFDEQTSGQHRQGGQSDTRIKYKQFSDTPEIHDPRSETANSSRKSYHETEEAPKKTVSRIQNASEEYHKKNESIIREEDYRRRAHRLNQESNIQQNDIRRESGAARVSDAALRKKELKEHHRSSHVSGLVELKEKTEQLTKEDDRKIIHVSQKKSETRMKKQEDYTNLLKKSSVESKEHSSQARIRDARSTISVTESHETPALLGELTISTTTDASSVEVTETNKRNSKASSQVSSGGSSIIGSTSGFSTQEVSDSMTQQHAHTPDRPLQSQYERHGEARKDDIPCLPLDYVSHEDALGSADRLQKSSTKYVGEFVEKLHEISNTEILKEKKASETMLSYEGEQHNKKVLGQYGYGDSQSTEHESKSSSLVSGAKGPSDEMWHVTEPSVQKSPEIEVSEDADNTKKVIVKRSGRSLWNIIGDIVQLRWISHSDRHTSTSKSGGRSSPNQSTSSETWFSGHEAEDNDNENAKKDGRLNQESSSLDQHRQEMVRSRHGEASSSSSSRDQMKHAMVETSSSSIVPGSSSPFKSIPLPSAEENPQKISEGSTTVAKVGRPLPSIQVRTSSVIEEIAEVGPAVPSSSGKGQAVSSVSSEISGPEVKDAELKRRKFQRADQVIKDRFEEWEEAYTLESEQRKVDEMFMREALVEARKAADNWEVPVGAVLVHDGKIVARGCNLVEELRDSTAHAEMLCIREASNMLRTWRLSETTLYVTLEPCAMCAGAILQARVDTVVWGAPNKLLGADGSWIRLLPDGDGGRGLELTDKPPPPVHPFHPKITIRRGVLASECADVMQQFFQLRRKKKEKKSDPPTPPSCLPISSHQPKFLSKMHDVFHMMFCL